MKWVVSSVLCGLLLTAGHAADLDVLRETLVDTNALNFARGDQTGFALNINGRTFQRFPTATFRGYQYAAYYDDNRNVCVGRRELPAGSWDVIRFTDYTMTTHDAHNVVVVGICEGDGTIHLLFDHHADPVNYRVSVLGAASDPDSVVWSTNLFGAVTDTLGAVGSFSNMTYPSFFPAPNGNLMLYFRSGGSGNGDGMIQEYDGTTHEWTIGLGKFISRQGTYSGASSSNSSSRNPYINGISYGGDRIHATWGWRESSGGSQFNHDLCYAYSDDHGRTWYNTAGALIGTTGSSFIQVDSPGVTVAAIPQNEGLSNQYTHYAYADGTVYVMVKHNNLGGSGSGYQHYWRDAAGTWHHESLSLGGSRPKLAGDDDRNLFLVYASGGKLRVAKGVPNAGRTAWSWSLIHTQSNSSGGGEVDEGGEGQIDYTRWEQDRVLSVYGQELPAAVLDYGSGTPFNGLPSNLHVFDYHVSSKAVLPEPRDHAEAVDRSTYLAWTAGIDAVAHRVFLGTNFMDVALATTNSPEYEGEQAAAVYTPAVPLSDWTTYHWRVDEVQGDGTVTTGRVWTFSVSGTSVAGTIYGDGADCSIKEDPAIEKLTDATVDVGARGPAPQIERCTVYVFALPDLGALNDPFIDATFTFNYIGKNTTLRNYDLYGLGRRATATVLTNDYYAQTATSDPTDATRLQTEILTDATPFGLVSTSAGGADGLTAYLNAQYAGGAGAGEYVFLRINSASPKSGVNYATLTMSEGGEDGSPDTRPRIAYQAVGNNPPTMSTIPNQTTPVDTPTGPLGFTVGDDSAPGSIMLTGASSNTGLVPVANIVFGGSDSSRTVTVTPAPGQVGTADISIIASDGSLSATNSFALTVEPAPHLEMNSSGTTVTFSWADSRFKLQMLTNDLSSAEWFDVPGGEASPATMDSTWPHVFFRLIKK